MSKRERDKGLVGEREVKHIFTEHDWQIRGLDGQGDNIAIKLWWGGTSKPRAVLHIETKRQETLRLPAWLRQAAEEAPPGTKPVVCFRQNRGQWYAALPLDDLLDLVG